MPLDGTAGYSENTKVKQEQFRAFVRTHLTIARAKLNEGWAFPAYCYFDLTAGPGIVNGEDGSPLIFMEEARALGVTSHAYLFEKSPQTAWQLGRNVGHRFGSGGWCVATGDNEHTAPTVLKALSHVLDRDAYGLIYADPNATILPIAAIRALLAHPRMKRVDVLMHLSGTGYKRLGRGGELLGHIDAIGKQHIWLREPMGAWDWSFAILTNWGDFPDFRTIRFFRIDTPEGTDIADKLHMRRADYRVRGPLPLLIPQPRLAVAPAAQTQLALGL